MKLHEQIRQARQDHGLSQMRLAKLAGVPRSVIQVLEDGGNITLETILRVLTHLPSLRLVALRHEDITSLQRSIADFQAVSARILAALDAAENPDLPHPARGVRPGAGGTKTLEFSQTEIEEPAEIEEEAKAMRDMLDGLGEDEGAN